MPGQSSADKRARPLGRTKALAEPVTSPARRLRRLFDRPGVIRVAGAHNALGARLAERAGFEAVWSSGLEVSASQAVPDADILTMPELLAAAQSMACAVEIPVIADCDAGYGNSNNVIHMIRRYEAAGIAAVCIEDKRFPKLNSFVAGRQELASVAEFVGKLMAAKAAQRSPELMVIARIEALIAGYGVDEALRRAHAYADAGADAVLIHDKGASADRILEFVAGWGQRLPVVVVPTTYYSITVDELDAAGVKMAIYANQGLRASIAAMTATFTEILEEGTTSTVESRIAPLSLVFELQGLQQLQRDEEEFLPSGDRVRGVVLAAGDHLSEHSMKDIAGDVPMAMLDINGKPLLRRQMEALAEGGVSDVVVVAGYRADDVAAAQANVVVNEQWESTGEVASLLHAGESEHHTLVLYGDVLCDEALVRSLLEAVGDVTLVVDTSFASRPYPDGRRLDAVTLADPPAGGRRRVYGKRRFDVTRIRRADDAVGADAEFAGIALLSPKGLALVREAYADLCSGKDTSSEARQVSLPDILQLLVDAGHAVKALDLSSGWMEIHSFDDYRLACDLTAP